ncbi:MAG: lysophospholipase [Thermoleophilia bacterium]|nr:lysophospholipase [Thermoleophilia bacterium]
MQHAEGRFAGAGGLELYFQSWAPPQPPRAAVAVVHGVGEHGGRYTNLVGPLVDDGYAVYAYDQRGHGRSPGLRVHIDRWAEYRDDLGAFLRMVAAETARVPLVVYGHSMGSLVVLDYLLQSSDGLAGAIISGVALEPAGVGSPLLIAVARILSGVRPRRSLKLGIDAAALSRDPQTVAAYRADPLVTSRATMRWGTESLAAVRRIEAGMSRIAVPLLVLHGEADRLNLVSGARALAHALPVGSTTLKVYPDVCHEPHNDLGHEQVAADVVAWLGRVVGTQA